MHKYSNSDNRSPSKVTDEFWLYAWASAGQSPHERAPLLNNILNNGGKWLIFVNVSEIDALWKKVRMATRENKLGKCTKVATMRPNQNAISSEEKVICLYNENWKNEEEIWSLEKRIRAIGIDRILFYKPHSKGPVKRRAQGDSNISKYISRSPAYDKTLDWFIRNVGRSAYIRKAGVNKKGKRWFIFQQHDLSLEKLQEKIKSLAALGFWVPDLKDRKNEYLIGE